jgi:ABC-type microcin C transport system duplicated ATPase subunit YejF
VQGQIIDLLRKLQAEMRLSYLFISHDLKLVRALCHRVLVMRQGRIVESGLAEDIFTSPRTAYTRELLQAAFA